MRAGSSPARPGSTPEIPAWRRFQWSVRREIRENRSVVLGPVAAAAVFLVGFGVSLVGLPARMRAASALAPPEMREAIQEPYVIAALLLMAVGMVVAVVYALDALYGERRDRSILFWKSMPVSDRATVLAKASVPILVVPLVTFAATVVTHALMLLASGAVLAVGGGGAASLWANVPFFEMVATNGVHLLGFHGIGYAPLFGWLLLASAWANRAPLLWAIVPPAAVAALEKVAFGTSRFADGIRSRVVGESTPAGAASGTAMDAMGAESWAFLAGPGPWIGLAVTALFLLAAVRVHRSRGPV